VLAFPANNFGNQEPGTNADIKDFCRRLKKATFPVFGKLSVKGKDQCPLYHFLTNYPDKKVVGEVVWNFQKYLVGRDGKVIAKFHPKVMPDSAELTKAIEKALSVAKPGDGD